MSLVAQLRERKTDSYVLQMKLDIDMGFLKFLGGPWL
jgi:hypothetical protein